MPSSNGKRTVLIVDDEEDVRHILRLLFEVEDYEVVGEASDGADAITVALTKEPDFVILDYRMPRMDGEEAARLLRDMLPDVRIIAFSAVLQDKPSWADAYLNKDRISEVAPLLHSLI